MNRDASITLRLPENAAALRDLETRRQALWLLVGVGTMPNVPAGAPNGCEGIFAAITEINKAMASLIHTDLVTGARWTH